MFSFGFFKDLSNIVEEEVTSNPSKVVLSLALLFFVNNVILVTGSSEMKKLMVPFTLCAASILLILSQLEQLELDEEQCMQRQIYHPMMHEYL